MSRSEFLSLATDYCLWVGAKEHNAPGLSTRWFTQFIKRRPEIKDHITSSRKSNSTSLAYGHKDSILMQMYYRELALTMFKYGIHNNPHLVYLMTEINLKLKSGLLP